MIKITQTGKFKKTSNFLRRVSNPSFLAILDKYGKRGVAALSKATPIDSGLTAESWSYRINTGNGYYSVSWYNTEMAGDVPLAVLIQYGHATRNGGYVEGRDFINPALRPIFDKLADDAWKEVMNA